MPYVLGYTEQGDFDPQTLPPAMLDWLEGYSQMIEAAQAQGLGPRAQARANDKENIAPLVSAHWSQGAPYNNLCPFRKDGGGRALTGCVATAAAQVAYYWRKELPDRSQYDTPTYGYGDAPVTESFPKGTDAGQLRRKHARGHEHGRGYADGHHGNLHLAHLRFVHIGTNP